MLIQITVFFCNGPQPVSLAKLQPSKARMMQSVGYAAKGKHGNLKPVVFDREDPKANEVRIDVLYCGVCHSDLHQVRNDWGNTVYPCLPGHEIVGRVARAGADVTKFSEGDLVGVGCMIDSCGQCPPCQAGRGELLPGAEQLDRHL
jgi:uncharacterized zinc-type alcohol dehydrogenase-like protein